MRPDVLIPIAIFGIMGVLVVWTLRRMVVAGGDFRQRSQAVTAARTAAARADAAILAVSGVVDDLRHRRITPEEAEGPLSTAAAELEKTAEAARSAPGMDRAPAFSGMADDVDRARRAIELVEHGRQLMVLQPGDRTLEGESNVKRGYLNLVHAQEAIRGRALELRDERLGKPEGEPTDRG
jgi:hypothetical protein